VRRTQPVEELSQLWLLPFADSRNPENIPVEGGLAPLSIPSRSPAILKVVVEVRAPADTLDVPDNRDAPAHPAAGLILRGRLGVVSIQIELVRHLDPSAHAYPEDANPTRLSPHGRRREQAFCGSRSRRRAEDVTPTEIESRGPTTRRVGAPWPRPELPP
jgi:hypothetical protein